MSLPSLPRTREDVAARIEDAVLTLRRVPASKHSAPAEFKSNWPDFLRDSREAYGYSAARGGRILANAAEIARMDQVLGWIAAHWSVAALAGAGLPRDAGGVAWLRCAGWTWPRIARWRRERWGRVSGVPGGLSPVSLRSLERDALDHLLRCLGGRPARRDEVAEAAEGAGEVVWGVELDRTMQERVVRWRLDGSALVQVRHASARWAESKKPRR